MVNNKPASAYAKPHTMSGKSVKVTNNPGKGPNMSDADTVDMTVNGISNKHGNPVKTTGIKMRGAGAATKGVMCRGPMA